MSDQTPAINIELFRRALEAQRNAYSPYSKFKVGAALLTGSGKIFVGANVENASYGLTQCAERLAVGSAVASGEREFLQLLLVSDGDQCVPPCGACRQVLMEFSPQLTIILADGENEMRSFQLQDLLPNAFVEIP